MCPLESGLIPKTRAAFETASNNAGQLTGCSQTEKAQQAKQLRDEDAHLKNLADLSLDKDVLQSVIRKRDGTRRNEGHDLAGRQPLRLGPAC